MIIRELDIQGAWLISGVRHTDERGWFQEWYRKSSLEKETGLSFDPVQANISKSAVGTIRGIHYSTAVNGQAKLVTVMHGQIDDYVIDIDVSSPTFGKWTRVRLDSESGDFVLLSKHMGHAFQALVDNTIVSYLVSAEYDPTAEKGITPLCDRLQISWSDSYSKVISNKDLQSPGLLQQLAAGNLPAQ